MRRLDLVIPRRAGFDAALIQADVTAPPFRTIFFAVMRISSSVLVMSRPCRRQFQAIVLRLICTAPWLAISLMPSLRTNRLKPWPRR
jgi:hypothetical protein